MIDSSVVQNQIQQVTNFKDLASTPFHDEINAICWKRKIKGNFSEILSKIVRNENIIEIEEEELRELELSKEGQHARSILLNDIKLLKHHGASPKLNIIKQYERDVDYPFFPTDVYSFHVDQAPIPTETFLCTYDGESSEILPNSQAIQKVLIPEIRNELKKLYHGAASGFDAFLSEYFFDLHYQAKTGANPIQLGVGHLWKISVSCPQSKVLPCIHRAPKEKPGKNRLLLIC